MCVCVCVCGVHRGCVYYAITHHNAPAHAQTPPFSAKVHLGAKGVFERLDNEMSRCIGKIGVISPVLLGDKLRDLQARRDELSRSKDTDEEAEGSEQAAAERQLARQAYKESVRWKSGAPGGGDDVSCLSYAGKWLPLGEGPKRIGDLVITVRETIGWKYAISPPPPGKDAKPSADRKIGLLIREFYIDTQLTEAPPIAPGLAAAWALSQQRGGP